MEYTDLAFMTNCPPDVPPKSRIVAVCGITDVDDLASPEYDGWFLGDFYLFHHLFHPAHTNTTSQTWLTCLEHRDLVTKYGKYGHGDPRTERRVVLNSDLRPEIERHLRVVDPAILRERFIKTVEEQARYARRENQQPIILILGHGREDTSSVYLGGKEDDDKDALLPISRVQRGIPADTQATLLLTSCFSGKWLVEPKLGSGKPANVTGISASGPDQETRSWSVSKSAGRACGSSIATAILTELMKAQDNEEDIPESRPTYIGLVTSIYDTASQLDTFFADQHAHFSPQDDDWENNWRTRIGTPLVQFRARWESLREIPPDNTMPQRRHGGYSDRRAGSVKRDLDKYAKAYFDAKPGRDSLASNVGLHSGIYHALGLVGRPDPSYSSPQVQHAMGLEYQSCVGYNYPEQFHPDAEMQARWHFACGCIFTADLFPQVIRGLRPAITKPWKFLAVVLAERCSTEDEIKEKVQKALEWKNKTAEELRPRVQAYKDQNDHDVRTKLKVCFCGLRRVGHKLHVKAEALTPSHQGYSPVPTDDNGIL